MGLSTDENVRDYLMEAEGKKRRCPTQVHRAIRETLDSAPHNFSILNGGIVIVAQGVEVDDKNRVAKLENASIINGSQTQGVLRDYLKEVEENDGERFPVHCKFELVVVSDADLVGEISIARNFQNDVMTISIAGRRGQLEELEEHFQGHFEGARLRKSETELSDDYTATEKLLQVITALVPEELWPKANERANPNKVYSYSMKAKCLKDYQRIWDVVHDRVSAPPDEKKKCEERYQFYLDIAGPAWELYHKWKKHEDFKGTRIHCIERDASGGIKNVPDGIVFPILASLSAFAVKRAGRWTIEPPKTFSDKEVVRAAVDVCKEIAHSNPWNMGKSKACYSELYQITCIYRRLSMK
jgi:hypothetical protein